jgi:hypothetical protein
MRSDAWYGAHTQRLTARGDGGAEAGTPSGGQERDARCAERQHSEERDDAGGRARDDDVGDRRASAAPPLPSMFVGRRIRLFVCARARA